MEDSWFEFVLGVAFLYMCYRLDTALIEIVSLQKSMEKQMEEVPMILKSIEGDVNRIHDKTVYYAKSWEDYLDVK